MEKIEFNTGYPTIAQVWARDIWRWAKKPVKKKPESRDERVPGEPIKLGEFRLPSDNR